MNTPNAYVVHSPTKITLTPTAKAIAQMHGMNLTTMARYLLKQHFGEYEYAEGGAVPDDETYEDDEDKRNERRRSYLPYATPSELIEDRRGEEEGYPPYSSADIAEQLRQSEPTPSQALEFRARAQSTPLGREAGYEDIGSHKSHKRSFRESNPLPADYYTKDPSAI